MKIRTLIIAIGLAFLTTNGGLLASEDPKAEAAFFLSGHIFRQGCVYKPEGKGPFPVMIYNQATSKPCLELGDYTPFLVLARFYTSRGYVFFLPGRRAVDSEEQQQVDGAGDQNQRFMAAMQLHNKDIEAAVRWVKSQDYVDEKRVFMSGHSTGALQSLLLAQKDLGLLGIVAFSPGAKVWSENALLRETLGNIVKNSSTPIFLIQPQNDFSLAPSESLGQELAKKGRPNRTKIFLPYGINQTEGNAFAFSAPEIWSGDVFAFMNDILSKLQ